MCFQLQLLAFEMFRREEKRMACSLLVFWNGISLYIPDKSEKKKQKIHTILSYSVSCQCLICIQHTLDLPRRI